MAINVSCSRSSAMRPLCDQSPDDGQRGRRHALEQCAAGIPVSGARRREFFGRHFYFCESLHFYRLRCASLAVAKIPRIPRLALYFAPRAGMAELVDAADSKSVALKRRVGSIPSPGTN